MGRKHHFGLAAAAFRINPNAKKCGVGGIRTKIVEIRLQHLTEFFYIYFITILQKYMVRQKICKKYTSGVVAHGVRDITPWAAALGAAWSGPLALTPRATALRP
jgi:hypothetical protein